MNYLILLACVAIVSVNLNKNQSNSEYQYDSPKEMAVKSCIQKQIDMFPDVKTRFFDICLAIVENRELTILITQEERDRAESIY